jgi:hypothetical protein
MPTWSNSDSLKIISGRDAGIPREGGVTSDLMEKSLTLEFAYNSATNVSTAGNTDGREAFLPANCYITKAYFIVESAFTAAGAATLSIGIAQADGTVINSTGLLATAAKTTVDTIGKVSVLAGTLVGGTVTIGTNNGFVYFTTATGPWTAGSGKLVIEYLQA